MVRVVTVTLNAAVDRTLYVESLRPGERHRVRFVNDQAGGKGVNVSRVLRSLGCDVTTVVVVGGDEGEWILRDLAEAELAPIPVRAAGRSRICLEIIEEQSAQATQIHGDGVTADDATARQLEEIVRHALRGVEWLALCGSVASGFRDETYARLVELARGLDVRVALDTSGAALLAGWAAAPDLLKINREEAAAALRTTPRAIALPPPREPGVAGWTVVSDGSQPTVAWPAGRKVVYRVTPPPVRMQNAIGAGDAMMAGLLAASSESFEHALQFGTALGAADAESRIAGRPDLARAAQLVPRIELLDALGASS